MNRVKVAAIKIFLFAAALNISGAMAIWDMHYWNDVIPIVIIEEYKCIDHHGHVRTVSKADRAKFENNFRKCVLVITSRRR